jgi:hypothetical protein
VPAGYSFLFFIKIATHPQENSAHSSSEAMQGFFFGQGRGFSKAQQKGGKGGGGATFLFSCLAPLVSCKRVFVLGEMGALFLGSSGEPASVFPSLFFHNMVRQGKACGLIL